MESHTWRRRRLVTRVPACTALVLFLAAIASSARAVEPRVWQPMEIHFDGPEASESDVDPNPFLDFRLQVRFTGPGGQMYNVPGFFNGDGRGGGRGRVWTVRFTPDRPGQWRYRAEFRQGKQVAVRSEASAGASAESASGGRDRSFDVRSAGCNTSAGTTSSSPMAPTTSRAAATARRTCWPTPTSTTPSLRTTTHRMSTIGGRAIRSGTAAKARVSSAR